MLRLKFSLDEFKLCKRCQTYFNMWCFSMNKTTSFTFAYAGRKCRR
uniref:Uncharacterized protein n=1 Tax=Rhizophora mucronata TaxID=61149 RepID=A0A2P2Q0L7_RHIMU